MLQKLTTTIFVILLIQGVTVAQSGIQYPKKDSVVSGNEYPYTLPIWGQAVTDRNIDLQLPLGVNVNYIYNEMDLKISEFGMYIGDDPNTPINSAITEILNINTLNFTQTTASAAGVNVRLDAWILPFLNTYGMFSHNAGKTSVVLQPTWRDTDGNILLQLPVFSSEVIFESKTFGVGTTFVYGWNDYFISADINYSSTSSELLNQNVGIVVASARIGKRVIFPNNMKLAVYFGAMYRDFTSHKGNTGTIELDEALPGLEQFILGGIENKITLNKNEITRLQNEQPEGWQLEVAELRAKNLTLGTMYSTLDGNEVFKAPINYNIKKDLVSNWTTQIGFNFEMTKNWMVRGEYGYSADQKFMMLGLQYRFGLKPLFIK